MCAQDPDGEGDAGGPCPASSVTSRLLILPSWVLVVSRHPPWGVYRASLAKPALKMLCFVQIRLLPPSEVLCESRKGYRRQLFLLWVSGRSGSGVARPGFFLLVHWLDVC